MISDERFATLDYRIVAAVLSSKTFLRETNMEDLSLECLEVLYKALSYTNEVYQNQKTYMINYGIVGEEKASKFKSLIDKIGYNTLYTLRARFSLLRSVRSKRERIGHIEDVSKSLNEIQREIAKRNHRG